MIKFRSKQQGQVFIVSILLKLIVVLSLLLFSELSNAASCYTYGYSTTNAQSGRVYQVYYDDNLSSDGCTEQVVITGVEYARYKLLDEQNSNITQVTSIEVVESFTWGFGTYMFFWFLSYCVKNGNSLIKMI